MLTPPNLYYKIVNPLTDARLYSFLPLLGFRNVMNISNLFNVFEPIVRWCRLLAYFCP